MVLLTVRARAYVYAGDWVADCPRGCGNAEYLKDDDVFHCSYCHAVVDTEWPAEANAIIDLLNRRPIPHTRNWYPKDHDVAVRSGIPHGQSIAELYDENTEHGVM